jgi:phage FluMu gp28-like protein
MEFDNGSKIHAIPTSPDAGRGEAVSLLIVDEAAWIADFEDLWIGLQPTLSTGGDVILISSPSGVGTRFHKIWVGAQDKSNDFFAIELPWHIHPEHDEKWFDDHDA